MFRLDWDFFVCEAKNNEWSCTRTCDTLKCYSRSRRNYDWSIYEDITILRSYCGSTYECTHIKYWAKKSRNSRECRTCKRTTNTSRKPDKWTVWYDFCTTCRESCLCWYCCDSNITRPESTWHITNRHFRDRKVETTWRWVPKSKRWSCGKSCTWGNTSCGICRIHDLTLYGTFVELTVSVGNYESASLVASEKCLSSVSKGL